MLIAASGTRTRGQDHLALITLRSEEQVAVLRSFVNAPLRRVDGWSTDHWQQRLESRSRTDHERIKRGRAMDRSGAVEAVSCNPDCGHTVVVQQIQEVLGRAAR